MGNEKKEENEKDVVEQLSDLLGDSKNSETQEKEEEKKEEIPTQHTPAQNTTVVTDEQVLLTKDIAKIDLQIEALKSESVDVDKFFEDVESHLTEEEIALEFSDKSAYMKLINSKAKEYEESHSKSDEIAALETDKKDKESIYERQSAITAVVSKYPAYKHEEVLEFFNNNLSKKEQEKIYKSSSSYSDVYENTYKKFLESNPKNIETQTPPNIPNVNGTRKQQLKTNDVEESLQGEDEKIQEALGL